MRSSKGSAVTLALALSGLAPGLQGCAQIAGVEDREVTPLIRIAEGQAGPRAIALDEEAIYWANERSDGAQGSATGGALRMQIKDDRAVIDLLDPSIESPEAIAVDATHIYWSSTDSSRADESCEGKMTDRDKLLKMPKDAKLPVAPVTDETTLWVGCGRISAIALGDARVYGVRTRGHRITWVRKDDTDKDNYPTGVSSPTGAPAGVAADGDIVYFTDQSTGEIFFDDTGTEEKETVLLDGLTMPGLIVVDEANLYWLTPDGVLRYPRSASTGEAPVALLGELSSAPTGIAAHGDFVYVTVREAGKVYRIRKDGTAKPEEIASAQGGPTGIAADRSGVYWTNSDFGQIVRFNDE
ncbi:MULTISPECIES: hypothetical protein [Sorangium]|uniref:Uncharacterized protein n=1 Tax=Sorangium cellulosum TaxID=56 RepID=A0A150R0C1_SORCE|nr:hypothetical protein [Sorangium cellulosum]KYF73426.1 hypothetical protein BE15_40660 [Sorangium cellulosum]